MKIISLFFREARRQRVVMTSVRYDRLFHVLVVVGSAIGLAAACDDDRLDQRDRQVDATPAGGVDGAVAPDGAALQPCFCDVAVCCDRTGDPPVLQSGFECCWSTTCD